MDCINDSFFLFLGYSKNWECLNVSYMISEGNILQEGLRNSKYEKAINYTYIQRCDTSVVQLYEKGYECRGLWSSNCISKARRYTKCYGVHTHFS